MQSTRNHLLLIALLAMLITPALHAGRITFDRFRFSVAIPDSGWHWDTVVAQGRSDKGLGVITAMNHADSRRFFIVVFNDSGGVSADNDALAYAFIDNLVNREHMRPVDTTLITVGGIRGVRFMAQSPLDDGGETSISMVMVCANEHGYALCTMFGGGRPEYDPELERIVQSFAFIGEPTHLYHESLFSAKKGALANIVAAAIVGAAIGIPTIVILLLLRRSRRRRDERAEREWENL